MLFPANESPTAELVRALSEMGASSATMPESLDEFITRANEGKEAQMAGLHA